MLFKWKTTKSGPVQRSRLRCSFCNKPDTEVKKLIAGPTVFICDECVAVCNDILAGDRRGVPDPAPSITPTPATGLTLKCGFCGMPVLYEEALPIAERGVLCPGCVGAIENARVGGSEETP